MFYEIGFVRRFKMATEQMRDEYIRQRIQYENLRRANKFFVSALFVVPSLMLILELCRKEELWHYGNTWIWMPVVVAMFASMIFAVHQRAADRRGDHRHFIYLIWFIYLIVTDLLAFNLQSPVIAQILLWSATLKFITCYISSGRGVMGGLVMQTATAVGLIFYYRLGAEIVTYNFMLMYACRVLSNYAYRLYVQKTQDQWTIRLANRQSERDPMTGLLNRRGFDPRAERNIKISKKRKQAVGLMMVDIDNFKKYNDTFGHPEGDKCIIAVAHQIQQLASECGGVCARMGGEEFVFMICGVQEVDFLQMANRLQMAVEQMQIPQAENNFYPYVTISIGLDYRKRLTTDTCDDMYHTADQALYRAKEAGRNCIYMKETRVDKMVNRYFA